MSSRGDDGYQKLPNSHSQTDQWSRVYKCLVRHAPILAWLPEYKAEYFQKDVVGGITLSLMCLAQTLAQAAIATTLPISGPYCAFVPPIVYAMLGTSRHASVSSGAMGCIIIAGVLDPNMSIEHRTELATLLALIAGLFQVLMGMCNLAFAVRFLSLATISGFVTGGAVLIMSSQLKNLFGYETMPHASGAIQKFWVAASNWREMNKANFALVLVFLGTLQVCKRLKRTAKSKLKANSSMPAFWKLVQMVTDLKEILVIAIGIAFVYCTMHEDGTPLIPIVGDIPRGLPSFKPPFGNASMELLNGPREKINGFVFSGAMIAFTSFLTTYASNKKVALSCGYDLDASQELFALGTASAVGSFFGAFLVCGSLSRTALAAQLGTKTQVCGLTIAFIIGLSLLFLAPILYYLPKAALVAIVLVSAQGLMDFKTPTEIWRSSKVTFRDMLYKDFIVWCVGFVCTVVLGALEGIGIAVAVGIAQVVAEATAPKAVVLGSVKSLGGQMRDIAEWPEADTVPGLLVFEFRGALCFCSAEGFHEELMSKVTDDVRAVVLSFQAVEYVDYSALSVLKEVFSHFKASGIFCVVAGQRNNVDRVLQEKLRGANESLSHRLEGLAVDEAVAMVTRHLKTGRLTRQESEDKFLAELRDDSSHSMKFAHLRA